MNCLSHFIDRLREHPTRLAYASPSEMPMCYAEFTQLVACIQREFDTRGIRQGDRVLVYCRPSASMFAAITAAIGLGITVVFLEPWMTEFKKISKHLAPKLVLTDSITTLLWRNHDFKSLDITKISPTKHFSLEIKSVSGDTDAIIAFSSGTFGNAKGSIRTHDFLTTLVEFLSQGDNQETLPKPDLAVLPGIAMLHLMTGRGTIWAGHRWTDANLDRLEKLCNRFEPSTLSTGPAFLKIILDRARPSIPTLKKIYIGGAPCDLKTAEHAVRNWPHTHIMHIYGSTEIEPIALCDAKTAIDKSKEQGHAQMLYIGTPLPHIQWTLENDELLVNSTSICPKKVTWEHSRIVFSSRSVNDWHRTGDRMCLVGKDLYFAGRSNIPSGVFLKEQRIYNVLKRTDCFIHRTQNNKDVLIAPFKVDRSKFSDLNIDDSLKKTIVWDKRHQSRLNRNETILPNTSFKKWYHYIQERAPIGAMALISGGICLTAREDQPLSIVTMLLFLFIVTSLFLMRLLDEIKDHGKDCETHPSRPLARGLIAVSEAESAARVIFAALLILTTMIGYISFISGCTALLAILWIKLIAEDFYLRPVLKRYLLVSTVLHQLVILPLYFLPFTVNPEPMNKAYWFVSASFFGSLLYEFTRKINIHVIPGETNYAKEYGLEVIGALIAFCVVGFVLSLNALHFQIIALICGSTIGMALIPYYLRQSSSKPLELSAVLSNLMTFWCSPVSRMFF